MHSIWVMEMYIGMYWRIINLLSNGYIPFWQCTRGKNKQDILVGKTWPTLNILGYFWASWVVVGPQLSNGCLNMDVNIDYGTMTPRVANWLPKAIGMIFFFLGGNQWPWIVTLNNKLQQIEIFFWLQYFFLMQIP